MTPQIRHHLRAMFSQISSTQIVADGFNNQKHIQARLKSKRLGRPARATGTLVHCHILSRVHRYSEVRPDSSSVARGAHAPASFFVPESNESSLNFTKVQGKKAQPDWWSPNAERSVVSISDLELLRTVADTDTWQSLEHSCLGTLCRWQHKMLLRRRDVERLGWHFALGPCGESAVLIGPCREVEVPGIQGVSFSQPDVFLSRPTFACVLDLPSWEASGFVWRSPAWVRANRGRAPND